MQKKPLILIICGAVVILAIILLVVYLAKGGSTDIKDIASSNKQETEVGIPNVTLSAYPLEETDGSVEISINATSKDGYEITSITTPDGKTTGYNPDKKYTVYDNGDYSFTVTSSNGKTKTETITISNISKISSDNPYIPEGFKHIEETEVATGFTIEDKSGNQYVWVPVETGTLTRNQPSDKYTEDNYTASAFVNSVGKYYGFYIGKYEASKETVNGMLVAKTVKGSIPWANINYNDAFDASINTATAYNYIGVKTALVNSYAWDTTLNWLNGSVTNYSSSRSYGNYTNQILGTGLTENDIVNGIADMSGNLREWTTERYSEVALNPSNNNDVNNTSNTTNETNNNVNNSAGNLSTNMEYRTVRGGSATMDKIASSRIGERTDLQDNYWGFRVVLYKE